MGVAILLGFLVAEKAAVIGKLIREIDIPKECVVAAVIRENDFVMPRRDTKIEQNDHVIFVGPTTAIKNAQNIFSIKK